MPDPIFTISASSTARYATWFLIDELGLLLDAGDGLVAGLMQKAGKVRTVAISHADRDHLSGLLHFLQLFSKGSKPRIFYPESSGSFPALAEFSRKFDPQQAGTPEWIPLADGAEWDLGGGYVIQGSANRHVPCEPGQTKSLSYTVRRKSRRLKPEYAGLSGPEIMELHQRIGREAATDEHEETLLVYTADTPNEPAARWGKPRILIHEATFLDRETAESREQDARHSILPEVLATAAEIQPAALIVSHFSTRYSRDEITDAIVAQSKALGLTFPVYAVLPGEISRDILRGVPVYGPEAG